MPKPKAPTPFKKPTIRRVKPEKAPRQEQWYQLTGLWDGQAKEVIKLGEEQVVMLGFLPPRMEVAVCVVPPSVTTEQGEAVTKLLEANFQKPVVVLSNNIQLARLRPVSAKRAREMMATKATVTPDE